MKNSDQKSISGITRLDVLVILAIVSVLALLQLSASGHGRTGSHRAVCADNLRRLAIGWQMYADDYNGAVVPNRTGFSTNNWVIGWLDWSASHHNTNLSFLTDGLLYPYAGATEIYRCPADNYLGASIGWTERVRSYSLNSWLAQSPTFSGADVFQLQSNLSHIRQPDETFVFIEEHPDSINDGAMIIDMQNVRVIDLPAAYHEAGANLSFADGSTRYRRWQEPRTLVPIGSVTSSLPIDIPWLQSVTTYRK
jgi:prepilin-type processing-associated H-X9-DG protein